MEVWVGKVQWTAPPVHECVWDTGILLIPGARIIGSAGTVTLTALWMTPGPFEDVSAMETSKKKSYVDLA